MAASIRTSKTMQLTNKVVSGPKKVHQMTKDASKEAPITKNQSNPPTSDKTKVIQDNAVLTGPQLSGRERDFLQKLYKCTTFDTSTTLGVWFPYTQGPMDYVHFQEAIILACEGKLEKGSLVDLTNAGVSSNFYTLTVKDKDTLQMLSNLKVIRHTNKVYFLVDPEPGNVYKFNLHNVQGFVTKTYIDEWFAKYGEVLANFKLDNTGLGNGTRRVVMRLKEGIPVTRVPDFMRYDMFSAYITCSDRSPLCLKCRTRGHIARDCICKRCSECKQMVPKEHQCSGQLWSKRLFGQQTPMEEEEIFYVDDSAMEAEFPSIKRQLPQEVENIPSPIESLKKSKCEENENSDVLEKKQIAPASLGCAGIVSPLITCWADAIDDFPPEKSTTGSGEQQTVSDSERSEASTVKASPEISKVQTESDDSVSPVYSDVEEGEGYGDLHLPPGRVSYPRCTSKQLRVVLESLKQDMADLQVQNPIGMKDESELVIKEEHVESCIEQVEKLLEERSNPPSASKPPPGLTRRASLPRRARKKSA